MKKYIKPAIEVANIEIQTVLTGASETVVVDTSETVEAADIESRRNYSVWDDEELEEEEF